MPHLQMAAGYQPLIHAGVVRQAAEMRAIASGEALRTGSRSEVTFHFLYYAEYLVVGSTFLFREGRAKGIGKVVRLLHGPQPAAAPQAQPLVQAASPAPGAGEGGGGGQQQQQQEQQSN